MLAYRLRSWPTVARRWAAGVGAARARAPAAASAAPAVACAHARAVARAPARPGALAWRALSGTAAEPAPPARPAKSAEEIVGEATTLKLPDDGHKVASIVSWAMLEGATVKVNDVVCEIDTSEYTYDFQSQESGVLAKILVGAGAKIGPGTVLAYLSKTKDQVAPLLAAIAEIESKHVAAAAAARAAAALAPAPPPELAAALAAAAEPVPPGLALDVLSAAVAAPAAAAHAPGAGSEAVSRFLAGLESDMSQYAAKFIEDGFDSLAAIETLQVKDLEDMAVKKGHMRIIIKGIEDLLAAKAKA
jgi:pyruvate/2-oxoglutarate dehydrogenase complex dihydrolipoamide acyltransferase (E2) component